MSTIPIKLVETKHEVLRKRCYDSISVLLFHTLGLDTGHRALGVRYVGNHDEQSTYEPLIILKVRQIFPILLILVRYVRYRELFHRRSPRYKTYCSLVYRLGVRSGGMLSQCPVVTQ